MVDIICDTNFLIQLATSRIKNISNLDTEIGSISFVVPNVVVYELRKLCDDPDKRQKAEMTLQYIKGFKRLSIDGSFADKEILEYVKNNGGITATLDKALKSKIKTCGGSIMSLWQDRIVLED